jgi:hypothetical protein
MTSCAASASTLMFLPATAMCPLTRRSRSHLQPRACARLPPGGRVRWPCAVSPRDRTLISGCNPSVSVDTAGMIRYPTCTVVRGVPGG